MSILLYLFDAIQGFSFRTFSFSPFPPIVPRGLGANVFKKKLAPLFSRSCTFVQVNVRFHGAVSMLRTVLRSL